MLFMAQLRLSIQSSASNDYLRTTNPNPTVHFISVHIFRACKLINSFLKNFNGVDVMSCNNPTIRSCKITL